MLPAGAAIGGSIALDGADLLQKSERDMCDIRGRDVGMVFQEPMTAIDPLKTIGDQVAETVLAHTRTSRAEVAIIARETLDRVGLDAERFPLDRYPHELSGGQRQRVVIAMAIALRPRLLIADEPTTALDVTTQEQILVLLRRLVDEDGMGMIFITHDLAVVAGLADRVAIMRHGEIVETGDTATVFRELRHTYTRALFEASSHVPAPRRRRRRRPANAGAGGRRTSSATTALPRRHLLRPAGAISAPSTASASASSAARMSGWSANPARASRRWRARSWRSSRCRAEPWCSMARR